MVEGPALVRVVCGAPNETELAALVAVLSALGRQASPYAGPALQTAWRSKELAVGATARPGPAAWRTSAVPR